MKKAISIILALVMTLAVLTACGSSSTQPAATSAPAANDAAASAEPAKDVRLLKTSMPTAWDETHGYTQALIAMNKYLDEVSGGTLQLDIYAGGQLGDETAIFECLQLGTVDCAIFNAASLSNFTHALEAFDLPYLYTDDEGWANQELQNAVVSSDFAGLDTDTFKFSKDYCNVSKSFSVCIKFSSKLLLISTPSTYEILMIVPLLLT